MMRNKRGLELSINFIVMLILAITVLGFGIYFLSKLGLTANEFRDDADARTKQEIERLLSDGAKVGIPFTQQEIGRKEVAYFRIGVLNVLGSEKTFTISVEYQTGYRSDKSAICGTPDTPLCSHFMSILPEDDITLTDLQPNTQVVKRIGIGPTGADKGTYVFNVQVTYTDGDGEDEVYDFKKIYVKVK